MLKSEKRILIVDDTVEIHQDFRKIFDVNTQNNVISSAREMIFGSPEKKAVKKNEFSFSLSKLSNALPLHFNHII